MNELMLQVIIPIIVALISGGLISGVVTAILQKRSEREQRIFEAKFDAYTNFVEKLLGLYDINPDSVKKMDVFTLDAQSSRVILVSPEALSKEVRKFNRLLDDVVKQQQVKQDKGKSEVEKKEVEKVFHKQVKKIVRLREKLLKDLRKDLEIAAERQKGLTERIKKKTQRILKKQKC